MQLPDLEYLATLPIDQQIIIKKMTINSTELNAIPVAYLPDVVTDKYFFISYSHLDYKEVYSDIFDLQQKGLSIWYDRGIPAGNNWKEIAIKYIGPFSCKGTIFYISENALMSDSILEEVKSAISYNKPFLVILITKQKESLRELINRLYKENKINEEKYQYYLDVFKEEVIYLSISDPSETKVEKILNSLPKQKKLVLTQCRVLGCDPEETPEGYAKPNAIEIVVGGLNDLYATKVEVKDYLALLNNETLNNDGIMDHTQDTTALSNKKLGFNPGDLDLTELRVFNVTLGIAAFANVSTLEYFEFPSIAFPGNASMVSRYAFYRCKRLKEFKVIQRKGPKRFIALEEGAFRECSSLEHFDFENVAFDRDCFASCKSLKEADLSKSLCKRSSDPDVFGFAIPEYAFVWCSSLKKVVFPENLIEIRNSAFFGTAIEELVLPPHVKCIGQFAFTACKELKTITLNKELQLIGGGAFHACDKLTKIIYPGLSTDNFIKTFNDWIGYNEQQIEIVCEDKTLFLRPYKE